MISGYSSARLFGSAVLAAVCVVVGFFPCRAQADPELSGDLTLNFTRITDGQGNVTGYSYGGAVVNLGIDANLPITLSTTIDPAWATQPVVNWTNDFAWSNGLGIQLINGVTIAKAMYGDGAGEPSLSDNLDAINVLVGTGPTEKTVSVEPLHITSPNIPGFAVDFGASATFKFDVTVPSPAHVVMDQPTIVLEKLTVQSGASLIGNGNFTVRTDLNNHGFVGNLGGIVEGNFVNDGDVATANRAIVTNDFYVKGRFLNIGELQVNSGALRITDGSNFGTLIVGGGSIYNSQLFTNFGAFKLNGGSFFAYAPFENQGRFEWSFGSVFGTSLTNSSASFTILANTSVGAGYYNNPAHGFTRFSGMTNSGIVTQSGTANLAVMQDVVINNQAGAHWDLQSDTGFAFYNDFYGGGNGAVFNNSGTFRKGGGTGTSSVTGISFNNTGTIEVDNGTLYFQAGSSSNGIFAFSNNARLIASLDWSGTNRASGMGILEPWGTIQTGKTATFDGFTGGSNIEIIGNLTVSNNSTLNFNLTGTSKVKLDDASSHTWLNATGIVNNFGNFEWKSGTIYGSGFTNSSASFTILANTSTGAGYYGNPAHGFTRFSGMTNDGIVTQSGTANLAVMQDVVINNQAGALWDLQSDTGISFYNDFYGGGSQAVFNNAGTFRKSGGTETSPIAYLAFHNTGTIEVDSGTLTFSGGGSSTNGKLIARRPGRINIANNFVLNGQNTVSGDGTIFFSPNVANNGVLRIDSSATVIALNNLNNPGSIDLNGSLIVDYAGPSPVDTLVGQIGTHIISSTIATDPTKAIGYIDNGDVITFALTFGGDANLDQAVDILDLYQLASHWQTSGNWLGGDFNYDGTVNVADLTILTRNWQAGVGVSAALPLDASLLASLGLPPINVPEPGMSAIVLAGATMLRRRRTMPA